MASNKKQKAKEPMKKRFIWMFVLMAGLAGILYVLGMGLLGSLILGAGLGALGYFLFFVLQVQRLAGQKETPEEAAAHAAAAQAAREIAGGGIVLLQNDQGLLPLAKGSRLNLVGLRCVQPCFNGGGSAASDESKCTTLEDALRQTGFQLNEDLLNLSKQYLKTGKASIQSPGKGYKVRQGSSQKGGAEFVAKPGSPVKQELPREILCDSTLYSDGRSPLAHGRDYQDLALVVLSRGGGEGYDFDAADLQLLSSERQLLEETCRAFSRVILVLNTANTLEMGWLKAYPQIQAVLWMGFPGTSGTLALGDILCGDVNPSGRLPDTWAASNLSAPAANNFCQRMPDGSWSKQSFHYTNAPEKKGYFIHYSEGIYVGYRYYETRAAVDPEFDYAAQVVWPFGYGLSYTEFAQEITGLTREGENLTLTARVRNCGSRPGRCPVQCYVTAPYTGRMEKSAVQLAAFRKTPLLAPGQETELTLTLPLRRLASFDAKPGSWVLEAGSYVLSLRADAHTPLAQISWQLQEELVIPGSTALFADADTDTLTRAFDPGHPAFTGPGEAAFTADSDILDALTPKIPTDRELGLTQPPPMGVSAGLRLEDVKDLPKEDPRWQRFLEQLTLAELCDLCGNGAWQTRAIPRLGIPGTKAPDGSTSMASTVFSALILGTRKAGITWPCPSLLAANFDSDMARRMGHALGAEGNAMGYQGWYAPSMNCHRTAFNSRNFEYYSEDPLLSGLHAAALVETLQQHKIIPYLKHFAMNERETNVRDQLLTWCGEQAIREIYLLPFELCVRQGGALGIMSSFNYIGHHWAGGSEALLTQLLKKEWGFQGAVVTDACLYPHMDVRQMVHAGGALSLDTLGGFTGGNGKRRTLLAAAQDPAYQAGMARALQQRSGDILYMVSKTME